MNRHVEYVDSDDEDEEPERPGSGNDGDGMPGVAGLSLGDEHFIGCNGRVNKRPDSCYSFWVGASIIVCQQTLISQIQI